MRTLTFAAAAAALAACAPSIKPEPPPDGGTITPVGKVTTVRNPDGTSSTLVDATSMEAWIHLDFATGAEAAETDSWDLRFQRFHVSTNGGATGTGGVEVLSIAAAFPSIVEAPPAGYFADADVDGDGKVDYAFDQNGAWYAYDQTTHVLTPRELVWIVRTAAGATVKLAIDGYYDTAGTGGWMTFHWIPL
ncbi:MAG: HmuY family protein [Deltaproteobacteria bacterium]|nr:HmuY family protein [Deltaproteobacteria bacterium]